MYFVKYYLSTYQKFFPVRAQESKSATFTFGGEEKMKNNWIKRFLIWWLLWWSEDEFMAIGGLVTGALLGAALSLILTLLNIATVKQPIWLYTLVTALLGAVVFQVIRWKYISRAEDYGATALLRQEGDTVIAAERMFTKNVLSVSLPVIKNDTILVEMDITTRKGGRTVRFFSTITVDVKINKKDLLFGFDPAALFRIVQRERSQSIYLWLLDRFQAVQETKLLGENKYDDDVEEFAALGERLLEQADYLSAIKQLGNVIHVGVNVRTHIESD